VTQPRLRFSPSPTGYFGVWSARTALFNWLYARREGGVFILRVEDTDTERNRPEWVAGIETAMRWLGLDWDEGPFFQSRRSELYAAAAEKLYAGGAAYYCDCTAEGVQRRAAERGGPPGYDGFCRERALGPAPGRVLRFRTPDEGETTVVDLVRGRPVTRHANIEDFALVRGNGEALFMLANVVDDIDMRVSHVVRGDDHLPNTPKYLLLWDALGGGETPVFAHLPMVVNAQRQKLSKRRDVDVAVEDFRAKGVVAAAMVNYLALLGWAPGDDREILTVEEMIELFRLEDVIASPAYFDERKLQHFNGEYIRMLSAEEFIELTQPFLARGPWAPADFDPGVFARIAPLVQERVKVLSEVPGYVDFLFLPEPAVDRRDWEKRVVRHPEAERILSEAAVELASCSWDAGTLHDRTEAIGGRVGQALGKAQFPIRVAVTGKAVGPPLFESLEVLGRDRAVARVRAALDRLRSGDD